MRQAVIEGKADRHDQTAVREFGPWFLVNLAILAGVVGVVLFVSLLLEAWIGDDPVSLREVFDTIVFYGIAIYGPLMFVGALPYLVLVWLSPGSRADYGRLIAICLSPICVSALFLVAYPWDELVGLLLFSIAIALGFAVTVRLPRSSAPSPQV